MFRLATGVIKVDLEFTESVIYRHKMKRRELLYNVHWDEREGNWRLTWRHLGPKLLTVRGCNDVA